MRSIGRPSRPQAALVIAAALVLLVALVLVLRGGGDDGELRIVRGAPEAGFPLRGSGAQDGAMIRDAADAWVRRARRGDESWADDEDLDVTVLWAGPLSDDTDGVVLVASGRGAVLQRLRGRDYWEVRSAATGDEEDPVVVAGSDAVLVREDTPASYLVAQARGPQDAAVREDDGLWHRDAGSLPTGALLVPGGLPSRYRSGSALPPAGIFVPEDAAPDGRPQVRALSSRLARRLAADAAALSPRTDLSDAARESAQRLVEAAGAAGAVEGDAATTQPLSSPRELDLVAERILEPLGPVVVLSASPPVVGSGSTDHRPRLVAAAGGTTVAGRDDAVTAVPLGPSDDGSGSGSRAAKGPALGAAYVRRDVRPDDPGTSDDDDAEPRVQGPYLLVAGDGDVAGVEVRAGRRTSSVPLPVGLVRAPWLSDPGTRAISSVDVAILGRTAGGALVVPSWSDDAVAVVQARE